MAKVKKNNSINIDKIDMLKSIKNIPIEMRRKKFWICCNSKKIPCDPDGNPVSITDPLNYLSFEEALSVAQEQDCLAGVGFVFTGDNNIVGVDIDHCIDKDGNLSKLAAELVDSCGSYTEISQSGEGLHIYMRGKLPDKDKYLRHNSKLGLEMYDSGRCFVVTGNMLKGSNKKVQQNQDAIDEICEKYMKRDIEESVDSSETSRTELITGKDVVRPDKWVMKKCRTSKNSQKFKSYWDAKYNKIEFSDSEIDLALCSMIAFYTQDKVQIERIVGKSKLGKRKKWRTRSAYRESTIKKALDGLTSTYMSENPAIELESQRSSFFCEYDGQKEKWVMNEMKFLDWIQTKGIIHLNFEGSRMIAQRKNNQLEILDEESVKILVMRSLRQHKHDHEIAVIVSLQSRAFAKWFLNSLEPQKLIFLEDTEGRAYLFFKNTYVEISKEGYEVHSYKKLAELDRYVWREQKMDRYFKVVKGKSQFRKFVRNVSSFSEPERGKKEQKPNQYGYFFRQRYYDAIRSALGEKAHGFKNPKEAKVTIFVDADLDDETHGGTGKSLLARSLGYIRKSANLDGKTIRFDNRFALQNVDIETQLVVFDDANKYFKFEYLFQMVTGDFAFEQKGRHRVIIPFKKAPKIMITTNHPMLGEGHSFERRQHIIELSSFYRLHDTAEVHGGQRLFDHWDSDEWNRFFLFMIKCISYYLKHGLKGAASRSYREKKLRNECSPGFVDWADDYIDPRKVYKKSRVFKKDKAYKSFLITLQIDEKEFSKHKFTTTLGKYARGRHLEINANKPGNRDRRNGIDYITLSKSKK